jgi:hypothetical protein
MFGCASFSGDTFVLEKQSGMSEYVSFVSHNLHFAEGD